MPANDVRMAGGETRIVAIAIAAESSAHAAVPARHPCVLGVFMRMILRSMDEEDLAAATPPRYAGGRVLTSTSVLVYNRMS